MKISGVPRALLATAVCLLAAPAPASGPGCVTACVECKKLYASDFQGRLWQIDPTTGVASFIGWNSTPMLDIAISSDGYMFGTSAPSGGTPIWRISGCDASDCFDGTIPSVHNSLGGDLSTTDLFAAGPPLARVGSGAPYPYTAVGGIVGSGAGEWCGIPSGDVAVDPASVTDVYVTLHGCTALCPGGGDMLARLDAATGAATHVGCVHDSSGEIADVLGLAFAGTGGLYGLTDPTGGKLLRINKGNGFATPIALTGGPVSGTGLAALPCASACDPDVVVPAIDCGVIAGPCGSPPYSGPSSIVTDCGDPFCLYANASDDCGTLTLQSLQLPSVGASSLTGTPLTVNYGESFSTPGVYDISWQASDSHGNTVTCTATVDVRCDQCTELPAHATNWWPLDEAAAAMVADLAGVTPNNGGHSGGAPFPGPGQVDGAQCFNGGTHHIVVPPGAELNLPGTAYLGTAEDFTIDLWVQTTDEVERQVLLDKRHNEQNPTLYGYMLFLDDGYFGLQLADGSVPFASSCSPNPSLSHCTEWVATTSPVDDGAWHFLAVTVERFSPTGGTLWVDGTPVLTFDPTVRLGNLATTVALRMAREQPLIGTTVFLGCLDEIEYFDRALSASEIAALYQAGDKGKCKCDGKDLALPCPIGQKEYDVDGDGCMESCICDKALLGECPSCPGTSGTCNPTGLDCIGLGVLSDSDCDCDYDLCVACPFGTYPRDTDGDGCEDLCDCYKPVVISLGSTGVFWQADPVLSGVDVVIGSLSKLKSSGGNFAQATLDCLANDAQGSFAPHTDDPPPGDGYWFLARPVTTAGFGTYDATPTSHEGRDPGIAASGRDCPP